MDDVAGRVLLLLGVAAVAAIAAWWARRTRSYHPPVDVAGLGLPAGIVVFTSTDCPRCKDVLAIARASGAPLREITYELEGDLQRRAGVIGVPLTVILDGSGTPVAQLAGQVRRRSLQRALRQAGF
ncbi:MAG: hypothetical protein QNJ77_04735 [Acidimicrobiia bacterium]|nr:hypothetical protein [Acidimicrobiia bacterium]